MAELLKFTIGCVCFVFLIFNDAVLSSSTPSSSDIACFDKIATCHQYGREICSKAEYRPWVTAHCAASCQLCETANSANCTDVVPNCHEYDRPNGGLCTKDTYYAWAYKNCKGYCRFGACDKGSKNCQDTTPNCHNFDHGMLCTSNLFYAWAYDHCRAYCGFGGCNGTNVSPPDTHTSATPVSSASVGPSVCRNVDTRCSHYGRDLCTNKFYLAWTKAHCAEYCGFCTPDTPDECEDKVYDCHSYDGGNLCTKDTYYAWAYDYCQAYCGFGNCKNATSTGVPDPLVG